MDAIEKSFIKKKTPNIRNRLVIKIFFCYKSAIVKMTDWSCFWRKIMIKILGTGSYVPEKVLTNFDLEKTLDTSNEWIIKRTGIKVNTLRREMLKDTVGEAFDCRPVCLFHLGKHLLDFRVLHRAAETE